MASFAQPNIASTKMTAIGSRLITFCYTGGQCANSIGYLGFASYSLTHHMVSHTLENSGPWEKACLCQWDCNPGSGRKGLGSI